MVPFAAGNVDQGIVKKFREASKMFTGRRLLSFASGWKKLNLPLREKYQDLATFESRGHFEPILEKPETVNRIIKINKSIGIFNYNSSFYLFIL